VAIDQHLLPAIHNRPLDRLKLRPPNIHLETFAQDTSSPHSLRGIGCYVRSLSSSLRRAIPEDISIIGYSPKVKAPSSGQRAWRRAMHLSRSLRSFQSKIRPGDLLHLTDPLLLPKPSLDVLRIATVYDVIPHLFPREYIDSRPFLDRFVMRQWVPARLRSMDAILAISEEVKRTAVDHLRLDPSKVHVVYPGHDRLIESSSPVPPGLESPFFLYVGGADPRKNLEFLLQAISLTTGQAATHTLALVGHMPRSIQTKLEKLAGQLGIGGRIVFLGHVPDEVLDGLYRQSTAFTFPSLAEGFGLPILEAMSRRCPVVALDTSCIPEVSGTAALLSEPTSPASFARALDRIASDGDLRQRLAEAGLGRCELFGWDRCTRSVLALYSTLRTARSAGDPSIVGGRKR
jgi:glycosyltransferase involved in cell wall biosynthesis